MYTFKAQDKSNAKRFLVKTCKLENFNDYITQHAGQWGTWLDADSQPVPAAYAVPTAAVAAAHDLPVAEATTETAAPVADVAEEAEEAPAPSASAFGAFATSQLTGSPVVPAAAAPTAKPVIEKVRDTANGITRPSAGTICDKVWQLCATMSASAERTVALSEVIDAAMLLGINQFTARTQYACWRKFSGIVGQVIRAKK